MDRLLTGDVWKQVAPKANTARRRRFAVAYVSADGHLALKRDDILICAASDRAIHARETSARILQRLFRRHVELRSRPDLDAKVAVFGRYAVAGSCNMSGAAANDLTELALLTDRQQLVGQATAFIHQLRETSHKVDGRVIRRILKIRVHRGPPHKGRRRQQPRLGHRLWLVSVRELAEDSFPNEHAVVERAEKKARALVADRDAALSYIRFTGQSRFRTAAREGDAVVQIWKPRKGKRVEVFPTAPIVLRQDVAHWTMFYIAEDETASSITWRRFARDAKKGGLARFSQGSVREVNSREALVLGALWK
jgi:hypothetical protein